MNWPGLVAGFFYGFRVREEEEEEEEEKNEKKKKKKKKEEEMDGEDPYGWIDTLLFLYICILIK